MTENAHALLEQARDWESSRSEALEASERRAWWMVRFSAGVTLLSLLALVLLIPFYKVVPLVFQVDKVTGDAMQVDVRPTTLEPQDLQHRHWAARYVQIRERYVWPLLQMDFETVLSLSGEKVADEYKAIYDGANALDKKLGSAVDMRVHDVSVTLPPGESGRAIVRFLRTTRKNGVEIESNARFIATLAFVYEQPGVFTRERVVMDNPLGFKVVGYAVDTDYATEKISGKKSGG